MTDIEMTRLCAKAAGYTVRTDREDGIWCDQTGYYAPLRIDDQALDLVRRCRLDIEPCFDEDGGDWMVSTWNDNNSARINIVRCSDLNRAIVECVASIAAAFGGVK